MPGSGADPGPTLREVCDKHLPDARRCLLAEAARTLSFELHYFSIGDVRWYAQLKVELEANIDYLLTLSPERNPLPHRVDGPPPAPDVRDDDAP